LVDDGENYATFLVLDKEMIKLTKQDAATLFDDEVCISYNPLFLQTLILTKTYIHYKKTAVF